MILQDVPFDIWYDALCKEMAIRGYSERPHRPTAESDYKLGFTIERSAEMFVKELSITE